MTKIYWQPGSDAKLKELFQKTSTLRKQDNALFEASHAGRESLVIPQIVKSCLFFSLGEFHRNEGDYITTTTDYFYSIFHSAVAVYKVHFDYVVVPEKEFNPKCNNSKTQKNPQLHRSPK